MVAIINGVFSHTLVINGIFLAAALIAGFQLFRRK
jgi:hypothetical protein